MFTNKKTNIPPQKKSQKMLQKFKPKKKNTKLLFLFNYYFDILNWTN